MNQSESFERAILAAPQDNSPRLIYADWLEEQGDPRGEYLRVETELADLGPTDPRRNDQRQRVGELRARVDRRWGTTFGLRRITAVEDMVYYLREFHRGWSESPELDPASLPDWLPHGLALIYRELGRLFERRSERRSHVSPFAAQDALYDPGRLKRVGDMVEFACENQYVWSCRFPVGRGGEDPPVYSNAADLWQEPPPGFQKVCDSLSHFLITLCLQEAVMSAPYLLAVSGEPRPEEVLTAAYRPLWLAGVYAHGEPSHNFFDLPGQDLLVMDHAGLWLGIATDAALRLIRPGVKYNRLN
jgi:uncharacterized protein (TIGR02996 family)